MLKDYKYYLTRYLKEWELIFSVFLIVMFIHNLILAENSKLLPIKVPSPIVAKSEKLEIPIINFPSEDPEFIIGSSTPSFKWQEVKNVNGYTIYINEINGSNVKSIYLSSRYGLITETEFKFPDNILLQGKRYSIQMRSYKDNAWSQYSDPVYFSINKQSNIVPKTKPIINLPAPTIITKNSLKVDSLNNEIANYRLEWNKNSRTDEYQIIIDGINSSTIFGKEYKSIVSTNTVDTSYILRPKMLTEFNSYRWRIRSKTDQGWSRYSPYHYFNLDGKPPNEFETVFESEEIIMRLKYAGLIDEMIVAQYKGGKVLLPVMEILSVLQFNHKLDIDNKILSGKRVDASKLDFKFLIKNNEFWLSEKLIKLTGDNFLEADLDYFIDEELMEQSTGMFANIDMRNLTIELSSNFMTPMLTRMQNEKKLALYKNSQADKSYPLMFNRQRKVISGGFLDYGLTANYIKSQSPYYSLQLGMGGELFGGDVQINSQQSMFENEITYSQFRYKWRYAFLNNDYISNISVGHNHSMGLQSYDFRGIQISNEPVEARRVYGSYKIEENTKPFWKVEIYHNNQLIDIVDADNNGKYDFHIPFSYGTTLLELHEIGPNGEYNVESRMYQIPTEQVPEGRLDYSANFGKLMNTDEYLAQGNVAYGINNWLTTKIGTDVFTDDLKYSSIYSNTTARLFDGYILNLTMAPNAYHELTFNSVFSDLASFNIGAKLHQQNKKLNPTNIKNELEGNVFVPLKIDDNMMSLLFRGRHSEYSSSKRSDFSFRTFYNYKSFSPSVEFNYLNLDNGIRNFESAFLNMRLNYSLHIPSAIFSGNIIDARFVYDLMNEKPQSINISVSSTIMRQFRVQLSHTTNFQNSHSDTQLRVVFDLPFFRSNTSVSKNNASQSFVGSVNYNEHLDDFNFYNRGMLGRSAATFKFFLDKNMNETFDDGEDLVPDMDVQINSIGSKRRMNDGNIIINDLEAYSKYDVKLVDKHSKNPLWFPYKEKFSFVSDPQQYKEIQVPFYEAGEVSGSVLRRSGRNLLPISGLNVLFEHIETKVVTKVKTMSDGSFYHYGVQPGEYNIYLDGDQLERLKVKSKPEKVDKLIRSISLEEDMIEFNFVLE